MNTQFNAKLGDATHFALLASQIFTFCAATLKDQVYLPDSEWNPEMEYSLKTESIQQHSGFSNVILYNKQTDGSPDQRSEYITHTCKSLIRLEDQVAGT